MKVGLDTPLTSVVASGRKWYDGPDAFRNHMSIQKYGDGILIVEFDTDIAALGNSVQLNTALTTSVSGDLEWLSEMVSAQMTDVTFQKSVGLQGEEIFGLVWPWTSTSSGDDGALFMINGKLGT